MMPAPAQRELSFAVRAMQGSLLGGVAADGAFAGAASDSRGDLRGRLFFALPGEQVDGFDHCGSAAAAGATAVVIAAGRQPPAGCEAIPVIAVRDPRAALAHLARAVRAEFRGRVVGVTGSNGKTTTKELVAAALGSSGVVHRTSGNLNTDVGLPLTVLDATGNEAFWILEMAMRARGEIAALASIATPQVGLVTNVAAAHLGRLGSLDEIARAKGEIFAGLSPDGIAVLPADEPRLEALARHLPESRKVRFSGLGARSGFLPWATVRVLDMIAMGARGSVVRLSAGTEPLVVRMPLGGEHNARNAAAAIAVAAALGVPLLPAAAALADAILPPHRSRVLQAAGRFVLDDCYNANPASMTAALQTVAAATGGARRAYAILGDMLELGEQADASHRELGREVAGYRFSGLAAVGAQGARMIESATQAGLAASHAMCTEDPAAAAAAVAGWSKPGDWILIKASRGVRLERAVDAVVACLGKQT